MSNTPQSSFSLGLPRRFTAIAFSFYMAFMMSLAMCFVIVGVNAGIGDGYVEHVMRVWRVAMPTAFVLVMILRPIVMRLVALTVRAV